MERYFFKKTMTGANFTAKLLKKYKDTVRKDIFLNFVG